MSDLLHGEGVVSVWAGEEVGEGGVVRLPLACAVLATVHLHSTKSETRGRHPVSVPSRIRRPCPQLPVTDFLSAVESCEGIMTYPPGHVERLAKLGRGHDEVEEAVVESVGCVEDRLHHPT